MSKKHNHIRATWLGEHRFDAGRPGGVTHRIDASTKEGPSPVDTLLNALAACTSIGRSRSVRRATRDFLSCSGFS